MDEEEVFYDTVEDNGWEQGPSQHTSVYELHRLAYYNNTNRLKSLLQNMPVEQYQQLDLHGNTALHVAAMRGNTDAVRVLLDAGLPAKTRSSRGWYPLDEACASRHMDTARVLQERMLADAKQDMKQKRAQLLASMREMPDYSLQLKWQLGSSVPGLGMLLRRYAPHDTYTIWKVGDRLRVDGSLMGLDTKSLVPEWKRGHFSLIVDGSPEGIAAAAAAAQAAVAAAAAKRKGQQQQQEEPAADAASSSSRSESPAPAPATPPGSSAADAAAAGGRDAAAAAGADAAPVHSQQPLHTSSTTAAAVDCGAVQQYAGNCSQPSLPQQQQQAQQQQQQQQQQQEFFDPQPAADSLSGPRLLFLNHTKGSWVDLSADKKALKLETNDDAAELDAELMEAMKRDMEKLRLKPRNFRFAPLKGWLGGDMTEKVEGWKCTVYEATGKLLAVSTSKARLHLPPSASFEDYLAAEYDADEVSEMLIDPLTPSGIDLMSSSKKDRSSRGASSHGASSRAGSSRGGGSSTDGNSELLGSDDADGMVWGGVAGGSSSSSSRKGSSKRSKKVASGSSSKEEGGVDGGGSSSGRVLRARCWMAQEFPMSLSQLLPLLDVIGKANKHMAKVGKFLAKYSQLEMFPVKLQVPLLLTVHALVSFKAFHRLQPGSATPPPAADFFTVPSSYKRRLLQDVMEKSARSTFGDYEGEGGEDWGLEPGAGWAPMYGGDEGAEFLTDAGATEAGSAGRSAGAAGKL